MGHGAIRQLRLLLIGAIVLPITLFTAVASIAYVRQFDDARDRLQRNLAIINEHAAKVFETFDFSSRYLDEIAGNLTDDESAAAKRRSLSGSRP